MGRVIRMSKRSTLKTWLLEIDRTTHAERFFDCGASRDGSGYRDVTDSTDPEVRAARGRFAAILATSPEPSPAPARSRVA